LGNIENHDTIGMIALDSSGIYLAHVPQAAWLLKCTVALEIHVVLDWR
jgi:hypothetical protein